jgi:hypothetical protein
VAVRVVDRLVQALQPLAAVGKASASALEKLARGSVGLDLTL